MSRRSDFRMAQWMSSWRSEEHTSELQSQSNLVCRLLLEKKKTTHQHPPASPRSSRRAILQHHITLRCHSGVCATPALISSVSSPTACSHHLAGSESRPP